MRVVVFWFLMSLQSEPFMQDFPDCKPIRQALLMISLLSLLSPHVLVYKPLPCSRYSLYYHSYDVLLFGSHVWLSASIIGLSSLVGGVALFRLEITS